MPSTLLTHESILTLNKRDQVANQIKDILEGHNLVDCNTKGLIQGFLSKVFNQTQLTSDSSTQTEAIILADSALIKQKLNELDSQISRIQSPEPNEVSFGFVNINDFDEKNKALC